MDPLHSQPSPRHVIAAPDVRSSLLPDQAGYLTESPFLADSDNITKILSVRTTASRYGHVFTVLYRRWSLPVPANSPALSNILRYPSLIQHYTLAQWLPVIFGCEATSPKQGASTYTRHLHRQSFPDRRIASVTLESCHHKNLPLDALPTPSHVSMGDQNPRITIPCPTYS